MQSVMKAQTTLKLNEAHFEWTIKNWSRKSYLYNELLSQEFQLVEAGKICFLKIDTVNNYFSVIVETCPDLQNAAVEAHVLNNSKESIVLTYRSRADIHYNNKKFISFNYVTNEQYLKNDTMRIFCSVKYVLEYSEIKSITRKYNGEDKPYAKMMTLENYDKLFKNQELCDVGFILDDKQIKAHTVILAAASSYFLAMFTHENMKESKKKVVDFSKDPDVNSKNFKGFLDCVYGCKSIADLSEMASEILVLADKFDVKQLKESCEIYLSDMLNEKNVAKILLFAEKYGFAVLKEKALSFAKVNRNVIKKSEEFDDLCQIKELMRQLL